MGYIYPNGIPEDALEKSHNLISVVQISEPEDEIVTRGRPYDFAVLNSPVTGHLGKRIINENC